MHLKRKCALVCFLIGTFLAAGAIVGNARAQGIANLRLTVAGLILEGKFAEAERQAKELLAAAERQGGEADIADALEALTKIYAGLKRYEDAEAVWSRCVELRVKLVGPSHALIAHTLDIMAGIFLEQGRKNEAQALWRQGLAAFRKRAPVAAVERLPNPSDPSHRKVPNLIEQGRVGDAEVALRQSGDQATLATLLLDRGKITEAVAIHRRLLDLAPTPERATLTATLYRQRSLWTYEQEFLERAVSIQEKALGPVHGNLISTLTALSSSFEREHKSTKAYQTLRRITAIIAALRAKQVFTTPIDVALRLRQPQLDLLRVAAKLDRDQPAQNSKIAQETFEAGQLAMETLLNATVAQMGLRFSKGNGALPDLIRTRQDLERQWQSLDKLLLSAVTNATAQQQRDGLRAQMAAVERQLGTVDAQLKKSFPQYFDFALPTPLTVTETQSLLRENEALAQFVVSGEHAYVWVLTKSKVKWAELRYKTSEIEAAVTALRCGLDYEGSWGPLAPPEKSRRCRDLLKRTYTEADSRLPKPLPFDLQRAHELYRALFGQMEELLSGRELLIVPSGPLSSLPMHALVVRPADTAIPADWPSYGRVEWLAKTHATTVLPSVGSLKALRQQAGASAGRKPYIAFANPLLTGPLGTDNRASKRTNCDDIGRKTSRLVRAPATRSMPARFFRGELANPDKVRELSPLVETADEVCSVAGHLGASARDVYLGSKSTEAVVKSMSSSGELRDYRVVHFATHGLLASETEIAAGGPAEPALVLTPPSSASTLDDGLLTAGEILQLKLNADWVILSACNTAGAERAGADALSGLTRAFFYAGSRSLLVSHWAVDSHATVSLITGTFESLRNPGATRAKAFRSSILRMIADGGEGAHPAYWAPFVLVGEGAAQ